MHMVKLRVTVFDENDQPMRDVPHFISDIIANKNEPLTAPIHLNWIVPRYVCLEGGQLIFFEVKWELNEEFLQAEIRNAVSTFLARNNFNQTWVKYFLCCIAIQIHNTL